MRRRRRRGFLRRNPLITAALLLGGASWYGVDHWLDVTGRTQFITSAVVALIVLVGKNFLHVGYGAIYVIRVHHPETGRPTCGYVGKTRQRPESRIEQHLAGSSYFGSAAQPWSDTVIEWWVAHESRWMTDLGLHLREKLNILARRPIYNYTMNLHNPRRVPKYTAAEQRAERDEGIYTDAYWQRVLNSGRRVA